MPNKPEYLSFVTDWLTPLGDITARSMFGGHALYCDGAAFALVANSLFLKADEVTRLRLGMKSPYDFSRRRCSAKPSRAQLHRMRLG